LRASICAVGAGGEIDVDGQRVRLAREARRWTQTDLAYHAGTTQAKVSKIENSAPRGRVMASTLGQIARALGVSADYLLGLSDDPDPKGKK
jgi:transcriptional regulator with XRE-family HTH domain